MSIASPSPSAIISEIQGEKVEKLKVRSHHSFFSTLWIVILILMLVASLAYHIWYVQNLLIQENKAHAEAISNKDAQITKVIQAVETMATGSTPHPSGIGRIISPLPPVQDETESAVIPIETKKK